MKEVQTKNRDDRCRKDVTDEEKELYMQEV
jgi:hypothetical protein